MDKTKIIVDSLLREDEDDFDFAEVDIPPGEPNPYDIWRRTYRPIKNEIEPEEPFDGTMFETYGKEYEFVRAAKPQHVWTYLTGDNNELIIVAGFHFVNRIGYFITEQPWKSEDESYQVEGGDPQNAQELADKIIEDELGRGWKTEWNGYTPEIKNEKVRSSMENYGLETLDPAEVMSIIDGLAV